MHDRPTPTRFGADRAWAEAAARPLRWAAGPGARPSAAELDELAAGLLRRDEPAAALARALRVEQTVTMAEIRSALDHGLTAESPAPLHDFFATVERRPDWVDDDLLERGGRACRAFGPDAALVLTFGSLLGGYRTSAALEPLVRTGRLTGEETLRRIGETTAWWRGVTAPDGLARESEGWRLAVHVRIMHGLVNQMLEQDPTWDWDKRGVPINQYDQASTLGVFSTSFMLHARLLGVARLALRLRGDHAPVVVRRLADGRRRGVAAAHRAPGTTGALPDVLPGPGPRRQLARPGRRP